MIENNSSEKEIDIEFLINKLKDFLFFLKITVFRLLNFFYHKKIIILLILIVGFSIGFILDRKFKNTYESEIIVFPNFGSVDYLYSEIENFKHNLLSKKLTKSQADDLLNINVKPIFNIDDLNNYNMLDLSKVMANKNEPLKKILEDNILSNSFKSHLITITTKSNLHSDQIASNLLKYLNSSEYYTKVSVNELSSLKIRKDQLERSMSQINEILDRVGEGNLKEDNTSNYGEISTTFELKEKYANQLADIKNKEFSYKNTIFNVSESLNNKINHKFYNRYSFQIPFLLLSIYLIYNFLILFYCILKVSYSKYAE